MHKRKVFGRSSQHIAKSQNQGRLQRQLETKPSHLRYRPTTESALKIPCTVHTTDNNSSFKSIKQ